MVVISLYSGSFMRQCRRVVMNNDEKRSHRLNHLLRHYLADPREAQLFYRAKQMGVSDSTARDYIRTVIIQAKRVRSAGLKQVFINNQVTQQDAMPDPLYDDVKALIEKGLDDDRILQQIRRACENGEVISNYERTYVRRMAEQYLGRRPAQEDAKPQEAPPEPDVVIPLQKTTVVAQRPAAGPKRKKLVLVGGIAAVIAVGIVLGLAVDLPEPLPGELSVGTDLGTYRTADIISVSGGSDLDGSVYLIIENPAGEIVWEEQVAIRDNGRYSTLAIAGGQGWDSPGRYHVTADNGGESVSDTFEFRP